MKKTGLVTAALLSLALGSTLVSAAPRVRVGPRGRVYVRVAPPRARVEARPAAPSARHVWIAGFHRWDGKAYVWVPGRWELGPRPGAVWVPGHWKNTSHGWEWIEGHWR
jgi:WXXGXW repeat (2 copies)